MAGVSTHVGDGPSFRTKWPAKLDTEMRNPMFFQVVIGNHMGFRINFLFAQLRWTKRKFCGMTVLLEHV